MGFINYLIFTVGWRLIGLGRRFCKCSFNSIGIYLVLILLIINFVLLGFSLI